MSVAPCCTAASRHLSCAPAGAPMFRVMRAKRGALLALAVGSTLTVVVAAPASAGFSAPVFVGSSQAGSGWDASSLAVNDAGEAVAAYPEEVSQWCSGEPRPQPGGLVLQALGRTGTVGPPESVRVPGWFGGGVGSMSLDDAGRVAVGATFSDWTSPSGCEPHSFGCCSRVAVTTWRLGHGPPRLAVLAPRRTRLEEAATEALGTPSVLVDRGTVTAVWPVGVPEGGGVGPERSFIEEAHGPFGGRLRGAVLATAGGNLGTVGLFDLGGPFAFWISTYNGYDSHARKVVETTVLHTATGPPGGFLTRLQHGFGVPDSEADVVKDGDGDVVIGMDVLQEPHARESYLIFRKPPRGRFGLRERLQVGGQVERASIAAGGRDTVILVEQHYDGGVYVRRGSLNAPFGAPVYLGGTSPEADQQPEVFVDRRGRAVVVFTRRQHGLPTEVVAATALPGRAFSNARAIAPSLPGCEAVPAEGPARATTSDDGHAVILIACDERRYVVFYSP